MPILDEKQVSLQMIKGTNRENENSVIKRLGGILSRIFHSQIQKPFLSAIICA